MPNAMNEFDSLMVVSTPVPKTVGAGNLAGIPQALLNLAASAAMSTDDSQLIQQLNKRASERVAFEYQSFMSMQALSNPKSLSHAYEFGQVGVPAYSLFYIEQYNKTNVYTIDLRVRLRPAKFATPIPEVMQRPGPTGKYVYRQHYFPMRPFVFEYGQSMTIAPKISKVLVWPNPSKPLGLTFYRGTVNVSTASQPTYGAITAYSEMFAQTHIQQLIESEYHHYAQEAAKLMAKSAHDGVATARQATKAKAKQAGKKVKERLFALKRKMLW